MTIILTLEEQDVLWEEAERSSLESPYKFENISQIPSYLGKGYIKYAPLTAFLNLINN